MLFGSWDDNFYCLEKKSGKLKWRFKTGGTIISSPFISNDQVLFGSNDGFLYSLNVFTGAESWRFKTDAWIWASPSLYVN